MPPSEDSISETSEFAAALPVEICDLIFSYVEEYGGIHDWYRLTLVNHNWYAAATPRLYHTFRNNGDIGDRERLWQFMRTVIEVPDLARHVKAVDFLHCFKFIGPRGVPLTKRLCDEYLPTLYKGMYESGIDEYEPESILKALRSDDRRPIVAMILACVTNLETLSMHVSYDDIYFRTVAENAPIPATSVYHANDARKKFAFKQLKQLYLDTDDQPKWNEPLQVDRYQPFIYFPQLREVILLHAQFSNCLFPWKLAEGRTGISPHLTNVNIDLFNTTLLEHFLEFLDKVPPLTSLSVDFSSTPQSEWILHGPAALWNRLIRFKTTLETLDIYGLEIERNHSDSIEFCPPVNQFPKLKSLCIQPAVLLGNCKEHKAPFQLMRHVPRGLDFLGLYGDPASHESNWAVRDLETQLEILAMGREPKAIHVEGIGRRRRPVLPVDKLVIVCRQKRIEYDAGGLHPAGSCSKFRNSCYRHERPTNPRMHEALLEIQKRSLLE